MTVTLANDNTNHRSTWQIAISVETAAYVILFLAALGLRWIQLGAAPLGEREARQAIAAWSLITPEAHGVGSIESPLVFAGAAIGLGIASATNAAARFVPMLGGLALTFSPLLFRHRLGRVPALFSVLLLAISPIGIMTARRVDGAGLSMLGIVLALAALDAYFKTRQRRLIWLVGIALGVAILADYGAFVALLVIPLGVGFAVLTDEEDQLTGEVLRESAQSLPWGALVAGLVSTLLILGTLFFLAPNGLGAAADQLERFAVGLVRRQPGVSYLGLVLVLYEPFVLLFGLIGAWLTSQSAEPWRRFLAGWGFIALLASLVYPGALPGHGLWSMVPLAVLAGLAVDALLNMEHTGPAWAAWVYAVGFVALIALIFAQITLYLQPSHRTLTIPSDVPPDQALFTIAPNLLLAILFCILQLFLWMMVAAMWQSRTAWKGLGLGLLLLGFLIPVGQSGSLAFSRPDSPYEPFNVSPAQPALDKLVETAEQVGELAVGQPHEASMTVQASPDGALAWALHDFKDLTFTSHSSPTVDTIMVITPADGADPALGSNYVGQDFVIERRWTPRGLPVLDYIRWVVYRTSSKPPEEMRVILWIREDIYRLVPAGGTLPVRDNGE